MQVSGRLFSDSGLRRSTRLSGEATNLNSSSSQVGGNGINHSAAKFLGGFSTSSKISSLNFRSVTVRKGQSWATESLDEGGNSLFMFFVCVEFFLCTIINVYIYTSWPTLHFQLEITKEKNE